MEKYSENWQIKAIKEKCKERERERENQRLNMAAKYDHFKLRFLFQIQFTNPIIIDIIIFEIFINVVIFVKIIR